MLLALSIVSEQGAALGPTAYKVFDERGGSIGRIAGNDWVLPDAQNFVSSRHALVSCNGGQFYLEDRSSNGTFINAPDHLTARAQPQVLSDGDRLFIGDYEIIVQLIPSGPSAGLGTVDPLAALGGGAAASPVQPDIAATGPVAVPGIDVTSHQAAMNAAVRAGFTALLAKLHPDPLEELFERKLKRTAVLGLGNKAKYWEMYRAQFEEIDRDREAHFQLLFGEAFTHAYDEHLQKLTSDARLRKTK
jgi:predicted component of type VI protein secretion system